MLQQHFILTASSIIYKTLHARSPSPTLCRSFEEMEAQITAGMKTPVLSSRPGPEGFAGDKGRKRESEALSRTHSTEREEQVSKMPLQGPGFREQLSHTLCFHFCVLSPLCKLNLSDFCHCSVTRGHCTQLFAGDILAHQHEPDQLWWLSLKLG